MWTLWFILVSCLSMRALSISDEKRLIKHLISNYEHVGLVGRPVLNGSDNVPVTINFGLIRLEKFDEKNQEAVLIGWNTMEWQDPLLRWDPLEFGNVEQILVPPNQIWLPDIILTNAVSSPDVLQEALAKVTDDGHVTWTDIYKYQFHCNESPEQNGGTSSCALRFASHGMDINFLNLNAKSDVFNIDNYVENPDWKLSGNQVKRELIQYPWSTGDKTAEVSYEFQLEKQPNADSSAPKSRAILSVVILVYCFGSLFLLM